VASLDEIKEWTISVARGETKPRPEDPKIWFTSLESLAQILSTKNRELLEIIRRSKALSISELAKLSGRHVGNLSRTLHTMERYNLVRLEKHRGRLVAEVPYDLLSLQLSLNQPRAAAGVRRRIRGGRAKVARTR
jgi:predicted transcriptional regulator